MKQSLIVLAILGSTAGFAQAQSSVTLYGLADVWVGKGKTETLTNGAFVTSGSAVQMTSGGLNGNRWGLRGTEDLGGGLKAIFTLESGFNLDTGTAATINGAANASFGRQAFVGLQSGLGTLQLGNTYSALNDIAGLGNSGFDSSFSASQQVLAVNHSSGPVGGDRLRPTNVIKYISPTLAGFVGRVNYALDEATTTKKHQVDLAASWTSGPINANFGYQVQGDKTGTEDLKVTILNGSYDLGVVKLMGSLGQSKLAAGKSTDVQFGVNVPFGPATVSVGYAQSKDNQAAGNDKRTGFGVAATYDLSKRSTLYTAVRANKTKDGDVTLLKGNLFAAGMRHRF
jgi:predicted porin